jgi:hypothetical protein
MKLSNILKACCIEEHLDQYVHELLNSLLYIKETQLRFLRLKYKSLIFHIDQHKHLKQLRNIQEIH